MLTGSWAGPAWGSPPRLKPRKVAPCRCGSYPAIMERVLCKVPVMTVLDRRMRAKRTVPLPQTDFSEAERQIFVALDRRGK